MAESRVDQARRATIAALTLGAAGVLCAWPFFRAADNAAWQLMIPLSGLAAFIVGGLSSFILHDERSRHPRLRGVLAGVLTGILSHPLAWYLGILFNFFRGARGSLGEEPLGPVDGLLGALVLSASSWLLAGWLTVSVGALAGIILSRQTVKSGGALKADEGRA